MDSDICENIRANTRRWHDGMAVERVYCRERQVLSEKIFWVSEMHAC